MSFLRKRQLPYQADTTAFWHNRNYSFLLPEKPWLSGASPNSCDSRTYVFNVVISASSPYGLPVRLNQPTQASEETNMGSHLWEHFCEPGLEVWTSWSSIGYWIGLNPTQPSKLRSAWGGGQGRLGEGGRETSSLLEGGREIRFDE